MDGARGIRVFISSTFRDMQLERDELVKRVFPVVRRMCEQRGVAWSEVDLRWGVTDEQKAEGAVLPICLAEIERTRPYFIGLLGQRYGWVPDELPPRLAEELGWLTDDHGRSVTELEILHGVLNDPDAAGHAFFYLRRPDWVDTLADDVRADYVEETAHGVERLALLRERIRASGHPVRDYSDPVALGQIVLADLVDLVERTYPDPAPPHPLDRAAGVHASYAASRFAAFVARPDLAAALDRHAEGIAPPLLVTGAPGAGASALVANWAAAWRASHPDDEVVEHYVAADADAADHRAMVTRIIGELSRCTGGRADGAVPDLPDGLPAVRSALGQAVASPSPRRRVLVIDGVDDLADVDGAPDLRWMPTEVASTTRIVMTASSSRPRATFEHRHWPILEVPPLDGHERRQVAVRFLAGYSKALDAAHLDALASAANTGNARFLRIVLDELRQHGDHFTLGDVIARLCAAATVDDLYEIVLARYEQDFERDRPGLVRDAMTALWAARRGLAEAELLDLLGDGTPLPQAVWAPLHLAAEQALVSRAGLLGLGDDDLRTAVGDRYLATDDARRAAHRRLADYFGAQPLGPRVVDELGWQLADAGDTGRLATVLGDPQFTELAYVLAAADLRRLWARADAGGHPMTVAYAPIVEDPSRYDGDGRQLVWGVARLLTDAGHPAEALRLNRYLVDRARLAPAGRDEAPPGDARLRAALVNLGAAQWLQGSLDEAGDTLAEAVERCRAAADRPMLAAALGNLGLVRRDRGQLDEAAQLFVEEADLCRELDDQYGLQASLGNHAQLQRQRGHYDAALAMLTEQERLCRDLSDTAGVARAQAGQATVLADRGDNAGAVDLLTRQADRCRAEGDQRGLAEALLNLSVAEGQLGRAVESDAAATECEALVRRLGDPGLLARVLVARATAVSATGDWSTVERMAREAELTARAAGQTAQIALALGLVGTARREQGDLAGCRDAHTAELAAATATGDAHAIAIAHTNLGNVAIAEQRFDEALAAFARAEPTFRAFDVPSSLLPLVANRAQVLHATNRFAEAVADYSAAAAAAARLGNQAAAKQWGEAGIQLAYQIGDVGAAESLWTTLATAARSLDDEALLQRALGEHALLLINRAQPAGGAQHVDQELLSAAAALLDEQELICRRTGDAVGLAACVGNRAIVLRYRDDLDGALRCLDEQLDLAQRSGNAQGVLFATANRGEVLGLLGRVPEALAALGAARATAAQYQIAPMVQQLDAMIAALQTRN